MKRKLKVRKRFSSDADLLFLEGDCRSTLRPIPNDYAKLIVTSPPYNIGKKYEKRVALDDYLNLQKEVIAECVRVLHPQGSICWQTGNYVKNGEIVPLDILLYPIFHGHKLKMRNRIVWHFEHGLHCSRRFSGRYETIIWFTKSDDYTFNLDPIRVPQKYPGKKHFKGPKKGQYSSNPNGKNPSDLWIIPNVKHNHPEKTIHPCQFPIELMERLILSLTNPGDVVLDPFMGVGTAPICAILNERKGVGCELEPEYVQIAHLRAKQADKGTLPLRPRNRPIYTPPENSSLARRPDLFDL